ncbi:MAG TPA: type II methionyl aminopeptidase [Candidatus Nanoarchaeia archaeon]|nr:type II methionyl aminopeptidase [Candidatus Nanoarchaeia archaeon]
MDIEELNKWKKAGSIASEAREYGINLLKENANVLEIAKKIEDFITKKEGKFGFPVQISINDMAAHYTPFPDDTVCLKTSDIVKLDLGVQIDGYIGDTAYTVEIGSSKYFDLIKASREALNEAIKLCKPGTKIYQIGEAVEEIIIKYGFKPIKNLSGHKVDRYVLHSNLSIPNFNNGDKTELEEGTVIAIEPFATTGVGLVKEGKQSSNYRLFSSATVRDNATREVLEYIRKEFVTLPFAKRHLIPKFTIQRAALAIFNLEKNGVIYGYPQLPEKSGGIVSQAEHTIIIKDDPIVLTK